MVKPTKLHVPEINDAAFEDALEAAYWEFDARVKKYPPYNEMDRSERDHFKAAVRHMRAKLQGRGNL